jgi:hypothetical protein
MAEHTYPDNFPKGAHWAVDEAWDILDKIKPGLIPDDVRIYLAGAIAGVIMRYTEGKQPKEK